MLSLYANVQHLKKPSSPSSSPGGAGGAGSAGSDRIGNITVRKEPPLAMTGVEMGTLGGSSGKRGSRSSKSRKKGSGATSASGRGSYVPVNGEADGDGDGGGRGGYPDMNGFYAESDEEEVDLGLVSAARGACNLPCRRA